MQQRCYAATQAFHSRTFFIFIVTCAFAHAATPDDLTLKPSSLMRGLCTTPYCHNVLKEVLARTDPSVDACRVGRSIMAQRAHAA